jgi:hypothetical protein
MAKDDTIFFQNYLYPVMKIPVVNPSGLFLKVNNMEGSKKNHQPI